MRLGLAVRGDRGGLLRLERIGDFRRARRHGGDLRRASRSRARRRDVTDALAMQLKQSLVRLPVHDWSNTQRLGPGK